MIGGIDISSFTIDVIFLEDGKQPKWKTIPLDGDNAFDRARSVSDALCSRAVFWDLRECEAIGIEDPRGINPGPIFRVQGAVLQQIPRSSLVVPWIPSQWRKKVGLPGNATKERVKEWALGELGRRSAHWPQDAFDAYCIALATEKSILR